MSVTEVTKRSEKAMFSIRCKVNGVFLSGVTPSLECVSITNDEARAFLLNSFDEAMKASQLLRAAYGSFDWRPVEVQ